MGRKVPMWQCLIVILAMIGLLMWSILMDNGGEPHIALILAAAVAAVACAACYMTGQFAHRSSFFLKNHRLENSGLMRLFSKTSFPCPQKNIPTAFVFALQSGNFFVFAPQRDKNRS